MSVKSCAALIVAIKLNKVALQLEKKRYILFNPQAKESWRNGPWFDHSRSIFAMPCNFSAVLHGDCFGQHRYTCIYVWKLWKGALMAGKCYDKEKMWTIDEVLRCNQLLFNCCHLLLFAGSTTVLSGLKRKQKQWNMQSYNTKVTLLCLHKALAMVVS